MSLVLATQVLRNKNKVKKTKLFILDVVIFVIFFSNGAELVFTYFIDIFRFAQF